MHRITDKAFRYVPSFNTDLAKRFKEIIEQQRQSAAKAALAERKLSLVKGQSTRVA